MTEYHLTVSEMNLQKAKEEKNTTVKTGNIRETGTQKHALDSLKMHKNESDSYHQLTARGHSKLKYGN